MDKTHYTEQDIRSKYITPALQDAGWDLQTQILEEYPFTKGAIQVYHKGTTITRKQPQKVDYLLSYKDHLPLAIIEAKKGSYSVGSGIQQGLSYAEHLDVPFVYSSNGYGFLEHDRLHGKERELSMMEFPSPAELYQRYHHYHHLSPEGQNLTLQQYYQGTRVSSPRYYQRVAINRTIQAIAQGQERLLLVMATGTGKTYTAFQIIWRLWKSGQKKRILFLVDRVSLARQTMQGDFRHFHDKMTKVEGNQADKSYEIYIALYQGLHGSEEEAKLFKQFSPDFFDLVVVDECHRGSAKEDSAWREILTYFFQATQIGLTATPKEDGNADNRTYFGDPIYTYSLKQGISDGYLAPYKVVRSILDKDIEWRPSTLTHDREGHPIEDRTYGVADYDRTIILTEREKTVARTITQYLQETDPMQKTIVFCENIPHAERLRQALVNENSHYIKDNPRYVTRITGDSPNGEQELEHFINPEDPYPVIVTTSEKLTTGVDSKTCQLIVLDKTINSLTQFKQIIGRGSRLLPEYGKYSFTIMDFRGATRHFADPEFDGQPFSEIETGQNIQDTTEEPNPISQTYDPHDSQEDRSVVQEETILYSATSQNQSSSSKTIPVIDGVEFQEATRMIQYYDAETGKLTTESLTDYSQKKIQECYPSLDTFLNQWNSQEQKDAIIQELRNHGILIHELQKDIGQDIDEFDAILHVAYNQKPLTRSQRVKQAKSSILNKYQGKSRQVIEALLKKYQDQGSLAIDDISDLKVTPFDDIGTSAEIVNSIFGGRESYFSAVRDVQNHLYTLPS